VAGFISEKDTTESSKQSAALACEKLNFSFSPGLSLGF
jgi:hypothetical protein